MRGRPRGPPLQGGSSPTPACLSLRERWHGEAVTERVVSRRTVLRSPLSPGACVRRAEPARLGSSHTSRASLCPPEGEPRTRTPSPHVILSEAKDLKPGRLYNVRRLRSFNRSAYRFQDDRAGCSWLPLWGLTQPRRRGGCRGCVSSAAAPMAGRCDPLSPSVRTYYKFLATKEP